MATFTLQNYLIKKIHVYRYHRDIRKGEEA